MTSSPGVDATELKQRALEAGFALVGVAPAVIAPGFEALQQWIERGYAGQMRYLANRLEAYRHPDGVLAGCNSVVMLAVPYKSPDHRAPSKKGYGRVASYACGQDDYHDWIHNALRELADWVRGRWPGALVRGVVDTAPLMERDFGKMAGLGWIGKNTLLIHPGLGSYFFLAALLTDITFESDSPFVSDHCGTCQACLDACPTEAFPKPYVLDARKCISYLTIEHRGAIPAQLRAAMQDWVFGCDVCQQVCPWNRKPHPEVPAPLQLREENRSLRLSAILRMNEREFRERFRRKAVWRTKWRGMLRNAMISTANAGLREMKPLLRRFLFDGDEVLRETAAWVINQVQDATPTMNRTARLAGYAAAEAVLRTSEAFGLRPMIFWEDGVERRYDVQFGDDVANGPLTTALQWLEYNPEGAVRCALTYESCLDLENCASQAIIVEVREYTDGRTMEMSLAIPYRTGEGPQGFGVHSPEWLSGTWDSIDVESFFEEFFAGFEQHEEGTLVWASSFLDRLDDV